MDAEVLNWRALMGAPGIRAEQRKSLTETIEKMVKSKEWAETHQIPRSGRISISPGAFHGLP